MTNQGGDENGAISFFIEEKEDTNEAPSCKYLYDIDNYEYLCNEDNKHDLMVPQMVEYSMNYTVKSLLLICEYYGFAKEMKSQKFSKDEIIEYLVQFESDDNNFEIVCRRQNMWHCMEMLKEDKFMKKYILW